MKTWMWLASVAVLAGCAGPGRISQKTYERMLFPLMSAPEQAEYLKRPTWTERQAYLGEIGVLDQFEQAPPEIQRAILDQRVVPGMAPNQVLMSWGQPVRKNLPPTSSDPEVARREGAREQWLYHPVLSTADMGMRFLRAVEFVNGVVLRVRDERR
jgi:hypothetical protein